MSLYSELELSIFGGRPIELYKFVHGGDTWAYSSVSKNVVYGADTYTRLPIGRTNISQTGEIAKADVTVSCPTNCGISQLFLTGSPENIVTLTIFRQHDGAEGTVVLWKGRVLAAKWNGGTCELTCESIYSMLKRNGLRGRYTRQCRHVLYGQGCKLDKSAFAIPAEVAAINGSLTVLTVPDAAGYAAGYFIAGMIGTLGGAYRCIVNHSGATLTLATPTKLIAALDTINLYPGCDHSLTTCRDKFNNQANNGSFAWIPTDNPFTGSIV
ncbi:phage BR0599 family protein [Desulfocastanea catecholica]